MLGSRFAIQAKTPLSRGERQPHKFVSGSIRFGDPQVDADSPALEVKRQWMQTRYSESLAAVQNAAAESYGLSLNVEVRNSFTALTASARAWAL